MTKTRIAKYISIQGLLFDLIVIAFTAFMLDLVSTEGKSLVEVLSPGVIFILGLWINFTITLYMGMLYRNFDDAIDSSFARGIMKTVMFLAITGTYLVLILFFAAFRIMPWSGFAREMDMIIVLVPVYPLFWGLCLGVGTDRIREVFYTLYIPMTLAIPMVPMTAGLIGYYIRWQYGLVALPLLIAAFFIPYIPRLLRKNRRKDLLMAMEQKIRGAEERGEELPSLRDTDGSGGLFHYAALAWTEVLIPVTSAIAMLLWQNMTMEMTQRAYKNWNLAAGSDSIIWSLFLSGIIPLRVLSYLAPPLRPASIFLSAVAIGYYVLSLYRMI